MGYKGDRFLKGKIPLWEAKIKAIKKQIRTGKHGAAVKNLGTLNEDLKKAPSEFDSYTALSDGTEAVRDRVIKAGRKLNEKISDAKKTKEALALLVKAEGTLERLWKMVKSV